mgnify:CR=1 FL=1
MTRKTVMDLFDLTGQVALVTGVFRDRKIEV